MENLFIIRKILLLVFSLISLDLYPQTFVEQTAISLPGVNNGSVAWGDYDNDGYLDFVLSGFNNGLGTFTKIFKNNGNNTFSEQTAFALTGVRNSSVAWGDYDNDGDLDLIIAGYTFESFSNITKIYHHNVNNTFSELTGTSLTGIASGTVAWGDYDNDGYLDILITGQGSSCGIAKIFRNNQNSTFTEQKNITFASLKSSCAKWGDYDNDGLLDILLTGATQDYSCLTRLYHNDGNNSFSEQTNMSFTGFCDGSAAWFDYNNDGFLDILLTGSTENGTISKIYRNNGGLSFEDQTNISIAASVSGSVKCVDYDNDGKSDVFISGQDDSYNQIMKVFHNDGNNSYTEIVSLTGVYYSAIDIGDYDNDGKIDLIITGETSNPGTYITKIYKNNTPLSNLKPSAPTILAPQINGANAILKWKSVRTDNSPYLALSYNLKVGTTSGGVDIVSPHSGTNGFRRISELGNAQLDTSFLLRNLKKKTYYWSVQVVDNGYAGGTFSSQGTFTISLSSQASNLHPIAVQGTNTLFTWTRGNLGYCIVFAKEGSSGNALPINNTTYTPNSIFGSGSQIGTTGWFCIYKGTGTEVQMTNLKPYTNYLFEVMEFDFTTPGTEQYFTQTISNNPYSFLTGFFTEQTGISLTGISEGDVKWGDYDNDGDLDILLAGSTGSNYCTKIFRNMGSNTFTEQTPISLTPVDYGSVDWGDYDNDGDLDLILTGLAGTYPNQQPVTKIFKNNGGTAFVEQTDISITGVSRGSANWVDYNNDGLLDIFLTGNSTSGSISQIYQNIGNNSFKERKEIKIKGSWESSVSCGDYDKDGYLDLLLTGQLNWTPFTIIYHNNGDNTFQEEGNNVIPGLYNGSVAWGDYDNDGFLDILITGSYFSRIFRNNGNRTFTEQSSISLTGVENGSAIWGDYDNDGKTDILLTGETGYNSGNYISRIYRNIGNNTFTEQTVIRLSGVKNSMAHWGDYDNDGDLDVLLSGVSNSEVITKIYRNDSPLANTAPSAPAGLVSTVTNLDAKLTWKSVKSDITPYRAMAYNVRIGSSSGSSNKVPSHSSAIGYRRIVGMGNAQLDTFFILRRLRWDTTYYAKVQAVDNGFLGGPFSSEVQFSGSAVQSSKLHARIVSSSSLMLKWKRGNGDGCIVFAKENSTGTASPFNFNSYYGNPAFGEGSPIGNTGWFCMYKGDADSIVATGLNPLNTYVFHVLEYQGLQGSEVYCKLSSTTNNGIFSTGLFTEMSDIALNSASNYKVQWGDYDNDGYLDILLSSYPVKIYRNNGTAGFLELTGLAQIYGSSSWVDFNNDGLLDILAVGSEVSKIYINAGNQTFTEQSGLTISGAYRPSVACADYDNDGYLDFLLSGERVVSGHATNEYITKIYHNNGNNTFTDQTAVNLPGVGEGSVIWGDYDNDGLPDILLTGYSNSSQAVTKLYHNNGNCSFSEVPGLSLVADDWSSVAFGDYNNDDFLDILLTGFNGISSVVSKIYKNNGNSTFTEQTIITLSPVSKSCVAWGDYDNDRFLDILLTGEDNTASSISKIYHNNGNNTFSEITDISIRGASFSSVSWGDYDNDGDLDIIINGSSIGSTSFTKVYRNNLITNIGVSGPNIKPSAPANPLSLVLPQEIRLTWNPIANDETPSTTMCYNLRIKNKLDSKWKYAPQSADNGFRRLPAMGNIQLNKNFRLKNLQTGTYYWQVQAIDQGYAGGVWSAVDSFKVKNVQAFFKTDTICQGLVTRFTDQSVATDGIASWKWDFKDGSTSSEQNPVHTYSSAGNYFVKLVICSSTGYKDSLQQNVIVKQRPLVSFTAPTVCEGTVTSITNTTIENGLTISYWAWNFGDNQTSNLQNPVSHTFSLKGTYLAKLKAIANNGCADSISKEVIVAAIPNVALSVSGKSTFCQGDSVILNVEYNSLYSYQWKMDSNDLTNTDTSSLKVKSNSGAYSVKITNSLAGCVATSLQTPIIVNLAPASPYISTGGPVSFCQGDSVILSVTNISGYTYQWKLNGGAVGTSLNSYVAKSSGVYSMVESNSSGCSANSANSVTVTVNSKPVVPTVSISGSTLFCQGGSVDLSVPVNSAYTYQWQNNGSPISGAATNTYSALSSGIYSLSITNSSSCVSKTENVTINVLSVPAAPTISVSGPTQFCQGDSVVLSVANTPGYSFQWKLNGGAVGTGLNSYIANSSGTYSIVESNASGCSANSANTLTVTVNSKPVVPTVSISGATSFCQGGSVNLNVANNPVYSYRWKKNGSDISGATTNSYTSSSSGVYSLNITNASGCASNTENVTVSVLTAPSSPTISSSGSLQFCQGDSVILSVTNIPGSVYQWKLNGGATGLNSNQYSAKSVGTYTLVLSNSSGCSATSTNSVNVVVNSLPVLSNISSGGPISFCQGGNVVLSVTNNSSYNYQWINGSTTITTSTTNSYTASASGNYQLQISNSSGCSVKTSAVSVVVKPIPYKPVIKSDNYQTGQCLGENPIKLKVDQVVTGYNYQWSRNGTPISNATLSYLEGFLAQGDYTLEADLSGCKAASDAFGVSFQDAPAKPSIYAQGSSVWFLACSNDSASQYKWYYNGNVISGADKYIYVAGKNLGKYYVSISNAKGCFTMSDVMTIPTGVTGIEDISPFAGLKIYPNPTPGLFTIEMDNQIFGELSIGIITQDGREVLKIRVEKTTVHFSSQIDLSGQPKGMYIINLLINKYSAIMKVIVE